MTDSFTFEVILENPCLKTVLDSFTVQAMNVHVREQPSNLQILPIVFDSASQDYSNQDGLTLCGARTYSIISPADPQDYLFLTLKDSPENAIEV